MQCQELEPRLNGLLDDRLSWHDDPQIVKHVETCDACHQRSEAYDALLSSIDGLTLFQEEQEGASLSPDFSERVLYSERVLRSAGKERGGKQRDNRLSVVPWLATAATLLLAAWAWHQGNIDLEPSQAMLRTASPSLQEGLADSSRVSFLFDMPRRLDRGSYEKAWATTGRSIATFPLAVSRVTSWRPGDQAAGSIRSFGAALDLFLKALPHGSEPTKMPNGDTRFQKLVSPLENV